MGPIKNYLNDTSSMPDQPVDEGDEYRQLVSYQIKELTDLLPNENGDDCLNESHPVTYSTGFKYWSVFFP